MRKKKEVGGKKACFEEAAPERRLLLVARDIAEAQREIERPFSHRSRVHCVLTVRFGADLDLGYLVAGADRRERASETVRCVGREGNEASEHRRRRVERRGAATLRLSINSLGIDSGLAFAQKDALRVAQRLSQGAEEVHAPRREGKTHHFEGPLVRKRGG